MSFEIEKDRKSLSCRIFNSKGDYIDIDFPNKASFNQMEEFLEDSDL